MERTNSEVFGAWQEENIDIEEIIQGRQGNSEGQGGSLPFQNRPPAVPQRAPVPFTSASASRPSVLNLSTSGNSSNGAMNNQAGSPHSPHHSPHYSTPQQGNFNYQTSPMDGRVSPAAPLSPHARSVSPHHHQGMSPMSPHQASQGPVSPAARSVSPHQQHSPVSPHSPYSPNAPNSYQQAVMAQAQLHPGGLSPHHVYGGVDPSQMDRSGSISPVPSRELSPAPGASSVFGRYAHSPVSMGSEYSSDCDSYYSGGMKRDSGHLDKHSMNYRAKRERNNIAVRRSREKKKQREVETEQRVKELTDENNALQSQLDMKVKEVSLLKNLYKTIGVSLPPEIQIKLESELGKLNGEGASTSGQSSSQGHNQGQRGQTPPQTSLNQQASPTS